MGCSGKVATGRDFALAPRGFLLVFRGFGHEERVGKSNFCNRRDLAPADRAAERVLKGGNGFDLGGYRKRVRRWVYGVSFVHWVRHVDGVAIWSREISITSDEIAFSVRVISRVRQWLVGGSQIQFILASVDFDETDETAGQKVDWVWEGRAETLRSVPGSREITGDRARDVRPKKAIPRVWRVQIRKVGCGIGGYRYERPDMVNCGPVKPKMST